MDSFIFKGKSSLDFENLVVCNIPPITKPPKRTEIIEIDGKDGNIINELGYQSYEKEVTLFRKGDIDVDKLADWLNGTGQLIFSNEEDKYYNATIINQIDFPRFINYEYIKVVFKIQPFKYSNLDENIVFNCKSVLDRCTTASINAAVGKLKNVKVYGKLEQETRSGKNLLNVPTNFQVTTYKSVAINLPIGDYVITWDNLASNGNDTGMLLLFYYEDNTTLSKFISPNYTSKSVNITTTKVIKSVNIYSQTTYDNSVDITTTFTNLMISVNGGEYEQYGVTPSPDYPSEIKVKGDNINLFDYETAVYLNAYIEISSMKILASNTTANIQTSYIKCNPNTTYTISKKAGDAFRIGTSTNVPNVDVTINQTNANHTATSMTITTGPNDNYLIFTCHTGTNTDYKEMYKTVKVEKGEKATDYSSYNCGNVEYKCTGKNIFNKKMEVGFINPDGSIAYNANCIRTSDFVVVQPNTQYSLSNDLNYSQYVFEYDENYNLVLYEAKAKTTFTTQANTKYLKWRTSTGSIQNNTNAKFQLENKFVTEYEAYKEYNETILLPEGEFMGKIDAYEDYIEGNILHKKIGKVVLGETNDINWYLYTTNVFDGYIAFTTWNIPVKSDGDKINIACNYFKTINQGYAKPSENISKWGAGIYIRILASRLSTQDSAGFNQYIKEMYEAGTPVEIYYVLAEEYTVQLDEFELPLFEGINNISSDAEIEAEYYNPKKLSVNNVGLQKSLPIIKLKGEGISSLYANSIEQFIYKFPTKEDNSVIIDSIEQEAYYDGILKNRNMNGEFPELNPGSNEITWTGDIDEFEINPKSRWL